MAKANLNPENKYSSSVLASVIVHAIFFSFIFYTVATNAPAPIITVNLQKNPGQAAKPVKAALVDKKAVDQAIQRQIDAEKLAQEKIVEQQRKTEQLKQEALQAQEALELAKAQKIAQEKAVQEKAQLAAATKKLAQEKAVQEKAAQAKAQLAQQQLQAAKKAQAAAAQKAQRDRMAAEHAELIVGEVDKYKAELKAAIEENRILSSIFAGDIRCKIRIQLLPDGSILSLNIIESSGNPAYDEMSANAIYKSAPFNIPPDQEIYNQLRDIVLPFKNGDQSADVL